MTCVGDIMSALWVFSALGGGGGAHHGCIGGTSSVYWETSLSLHVEHPPVH